MFSPADTIAAIASAPGKAARGIVRISGPDTVEVISRCVLPNVAPNFTFSPRPSICRVNLPIQHFAARQANLPADIWLWPNQYSYTRQPCAEIHLVGSPTLLNAVLENLCRNGARLAHPGEFTLRAFLAGRVDLAQAEAVLGVIDSSDRKQLDAALQQLAGGLSRPLKGLMDDLLNLLADLEAGLDFVEEDIRFVSADELQSRLREAASQVSAIARQLSSRDRARPLTRAVLIGRPNAGKSSLFNALVGHSAAIVSPQPGATRDYLLAKLDLDGLSIELVDTAGLAELNEVDTMHTDAQRASRQEHEQATLRLLCIDATAPVEHWQRNEARKENTLVVYTKCDLRDNADDVLNDLPCKAILTSSNSGRGLKELTLAIRGRIARAPNHFESPAATSVRAQESLRLIGECLERAQQLALESDSDELIAAEIRTAWTELGKIVGTVYTDDLLDRIFSRFCIGK